VPLIPFKASIGLPAVAVVIDGHGVITENRKIKCAHTVAWMLKRGFHGDREATYVSLISMHIT